MIDIVTLREYIKVLEGSTLVAMELSDGKDSIRLEKPYEPAVPQNVQITPVPDGVTASAPAPATVKTEITKTINAPIVGVFYAAPSPDSDPFVTVGKKVKKGDVVCIIEAMKCMNEIQAEADCEITSMLAANGELVEYDQPLFSIKN